MIELKEFQPIIDRITEYENIAKKGYEAANAKEDPFEKEMAMGNASVFHRYALHMEMETRGFIANFLNVWGKEGKIISELRNHKEDS